MRSSLNFLEIDMQLTRIALAVAGFALAGAAFAAPNANRIAISAGASAIQGNLTLAMQQLCTNASGVPTTFTSGNFTTVVCANTTVTGGAGGTYATKPNSDFINFAGTNYAEFRVNVSNGSFGNIQILNNVPFTFRDPITGTNIAAPAGSVIVGGFNDVNPDTFPSSTIGTNTVFTSFPAGVAQVFGVGASVALYNKMFDAQKAAGTIPASCQATDTNLPYCVPSIGKSQMATIMSDNDFNAAYLKGLAFLTGNAADEGVELRYARRVDTSGTQASAQNFFLGLTCSRASLPIVPEPTTDDEPGGLKDQLRNSIRVYAAGGTSDVRNELNKAGVYALGVLSGENNQSGQNWRWLRISGTPLGENAVPGTAGNTNSNTMKNGTYDFYFEVTYSGGNAANNAFLAVVASSLNTLPAPVGLVNNNDLSTGYNKGGNTCLPSSSF
jgi:hypothetical protein